MSFAAQSQDGLDFAVRSEILGKSYFRVFQYGGWHYALAKYDNVDGVLYRSRDGLTNFVEGLRLLPRVRHTALWVDGDVLHLLYTRVGDRPELGWEGVECALEASWSGAVKGMARQLRDPGVYAEDGVRYVFYAVGREQGIAVGRLLA